MNINENSIALKAANRAGFSTVAEHIAAKRAAHAAQIAEVEAEIRREKAARAAARIIKADSFFLCRATDGLTDGYWTETVESLASSRSDGLALDGVVAFFRAADGRITRSL